jgi:hypothetical protein
MSAVTVDDDGGVELTLPPSADPVGDAQAELAARLVEEAQSAGVNLVGPRRVVG